MNNITIRLEHYDISIRALNVLKVCGIYTIADLNNTTIEDLRACRAMTKRTIEELIDLKLI